MKKSLFMCATAALVLTACSNDSDVAVNDVSQQTPANAVMFDIYTSSATRAGDPAGVMTTDKLKTSGKGFGVFAMYQDGGAAYASSLTPNFMFNEHVSWNNGWTYAPLKYWPNETTQDSQSPAATSDQKDKLSFFAYAPYVNLTTDGEMTVNTTGPVKEDAYTEASPTSGILAITKEDYSGDPLVEYAISNNPDNNVDLLWGVAPAGMSYTDVSGSTSEAPVGMPLLNMVKPDKDQKMKFLFQHALSRIGLTVVSAIDQIAAGDDGGKYKTADTRILIEEVKIWGTFGKKGVLNLNNASSNVANWLEASVDRTASSEGSPSFTVSIANDYLATDLRYENISTVTGAADASAAETAFAALNEGVLPSEKPLLKADASSNPRYFMVIPSTLPYVEGTTETTINVKITYHVVTKDTKLTGYVSNVSNAITKQTKLQLQNGKSYNLKLILGMTSVKLDATVADWQVADDAEINLPKNKD